MVWYAMVCNLCYAAQCDIVGLGIWAGVGDMLILMIRDQYCWMMGELLYKHLGR